MRMKLPTDKDVYMRLLVLKYVIAHALSSPLRDMLPEITGKWSQEEVVRFEQESQQQSNKMFLSMKELGIHHAISPQEMRFLQSNMMTMDAYEQIAASWRMEGVLILMWALNFVKTVPPIDEQADHALLKRIPLNTIGSTYHDPTLRERQEIEYMRDVLELWHWRSRTRQLIESGEPFHPSPEMEALGLRSFDDIIRMTAKDSYENGKLFSIQDDDFVVNNIPFRDLSEEAWGNINSIIMERHYALNWLCGYAPGNRWDETPTDT